MQFITGHRISVSVNSLTHIAPFWQRDASVLRQTALWEEVILFSVYVLGKIRLTALLNSLTLCALVLFQSDVSSLPSLTFRAFCSLFRHSHPHIQLMISSLWETWSDRACNCLPAPHPPPSPCLCPQTQCFSLFLQVKHPCFFVGLIPALGH